MSIANRSRRTRGHGVTMVELIIFIVVVSIAVVGVLLVMNVNSARSGDAQLRKQALSIAEALLEEVESASFTYCDPQDLSATTVTAYTQCSVPEGVGPETGNVRPYDNVNDYVTALGTQKSIGLLDVNAVSAAVQTGTYVPCITISSTTLASMEADGGANPAIGSALLIRIDVYNGNGITVTCGSTGALTPIVALEGYRTQYAPRVIP